MVHLVISLFKNPPKILLALMAQLIALLLLALGVTLLKYVVTPPYNDWALVVTQGVLAAIIGCRIGLPCWWRWIQLFIPIGLYAALMVGFSPLWALAIFIVLWLVFRNAVVERVPLYLTNHITRQALRQMIKQDQAVRFVDLGCGLGENVKFMAQQPNVKYAVGVETAPLPYLIAKFRSVGSRAQIHRQDLWSVDLSQFDLVYAFLSPEPMAKLWQKVQNEMQPGSRFVSNSFAVEGGEPTDVWQLADKRQTQLFIYHVPERTTPSEEPAHV